LGDLNGRYRGGGTRGSGAADHGAFDEVAPVELWFFHFFSPIARKAGPTSEDMLFFVSMRLLVEPGKTRFG
jgi:hypothetical protein